MNMEKIKLVVVDDHQIVRDGIRALLIANPTVEMIGEAANREELLEQLSHKQPDVIVMDIKLGERVNGIDLAKELKERYPTLKVIMLTANTEERFIIASIRAGAKGFLSKDCAKSEFMDAIHAVKRNQMFFGENISGKVMNSYIRNVKSHVDDYGKPLSDREIEIIKLLCDGMSAKQIGLELSISPRTVETHKTNILGKLGLSHTIDLVKYAIKQQLIEI
ncbi:MAG: response regulator transcription factor [Flammeovirgaceae bacterium]